MSNKRIEKNSKQKPKRTRRRTRKGRIIKVLLILFFTFCIMGLFLVGLFFGYIIVKSPQFKPEDLYDKQPSVLVARDGTEFARIGSEIRDIISYDQLPEVLVDAIVATEDSRFFQHNGFDFPRFFKASALQLLGKHDAGGASTLTMQISKNKLTSTEDEGVAGIIRKFTDIYLSVFKIEKTYTKQEIIEFYVNSNYLGADANGVEDASKAYFRKSAKDLNLSEAAMITGLFNAPGYYDPYKNPEGCEQRRRTVLYLMKRHGYITDEEYEIALKMTVEKILQPRQEEKGLEYQGFINTVVEEVIKKTGYNPYDVAMKIYTTMDKDKQLYMENLMNGKLDNYQWVNDVVQGGAAVLSAEDGSIVAIGTGRNRKARDYNYATDIKNQIGSTSKPLYDYSLGIEKYDWSTNHIFVDEPWGYQNGRIPVRNWDLRYKGLVTIRTALVDSINITAIKAFQSTGNDEKIEWVTSMGLHPEVEGGTLHEAHAIGGYTGESPLSLAAAYNTFATGGYYIEPYSFTKVEYIDIDEEPFEYKYKMTRVMSEETAWIMTNLLISVAKETGFNEYYVNGVTYAGKSGTSNYNEETLDAWGLPSNAVPDLWAAGYTNKYTIAIWHGYDHIDPEYYNTFGSGQNYRLFCAVARNVFTEDSYFPMPAGVVRLEVEKGLYEDTYPSEFTPEDQRVTAYFKRGSEPTTTSETYAKLSNVSNLTAAKSNNNKKVTLSWKAITTPNAINLDYWRSYFGRLYHAEGYAENDAVNRYNSYINEVLGTIVYEIYEQTTDEDDNVSTELVATTADTSITITPSAKEATYIVKTAYSIFKPNISDGVSVTVSGLNPPKPTTTDSSTGTETDPSTNPDDNTETTTPSE